MESTVLIKRILDKAGHLAQEFPNDVPRGARTLRPQNALFREPLPRIALPRNIARGAYSLSLTWSSVGKRGTPCAQILMSDNESKPISAKDADRLASAEFPPNNSQLELREPVTPFHATRHLHHPEQFQEE